jgi:hypothetical protein
VKVFSSAGLGYPLIIKPFCEHRKHQDSDPVKCNL